MLFNEIPGQQKLKERLIRTVNEKRISHAQLFLGPEGSGKLNLAIAYAQYINCKNPSEKDSCGVCKSCVKYNKLAHPDLHFIFPKVAVKPKADNDNSSLTSKKKITSKDFSNDFREMFLTHQGVFNLNQWYTHINIENKQGIISADDCNEIIKTLSYKSYESDYKVMIIWMVEKLYYTAAPKILKILEEPPEKTLFVLISENEDQIISTIRSRTQLVKIPAVSNQAISEFLMKMHHCDEKKAHSIAILSEGNLIKAISSLNEDTIDKENFELFRRWMRICYQFKIKDISDFVSVLSKMGREKQKAFLNYAMRISRTGLMFNLKNSDLINVDDQENDFLQKFYPYINLNNVGDMYKVFNEAHYHIERNANPSILFMDVSLKVVKLLRVK